MARKRRTKGEGSIYRIEGRGLWAANITLPDGTRKVKTSKRQDVVREWLVTARNEIGQGLFAKNDSITVRDFMNNYLETVGKETLRPTTQEMKETFVRVHINPILGKIKLKDLRPDHLQSFYTQKLGSGLSKRTVQLLHVTLRTALKQAVKWGLVARNVTDLVQAPRPVKTTARFYTREQLNTFLNAVTGHRWELIFLLLVYGGFREGEVLGIHVEDCDIENRVINVRHTIIPLKTGLAIGEPKTKTSRRAVTLPKVAYNALKMHLDKLGRNQGLIFTTSTGGPIGARNLIREFKKAIQAAGLPDLNLHGLRHSHASLLLATGVNPKIVQERLGHSSIALTLSTYSHVIPSLQYQVSDRLDQMLGETNQV
jgi:integrase